MSDSLKKQLKYDEGISRFPYKCTAGKLTVGVGRNLESRGLSDDEIEYLLDNDIDTAIQDTARWLGGNVFSSLSQSRQDAIVNMAFNLGYTRLSTFHNLKKTILNNDFSLASIEALDSKWASQVGMRAVRIAERLRDG